MSNRTYVCFDCRTTERVPTARIAKKCRKCRKAAHHVYYKFKIPTRVDDDGWAELERRVRPMNLEMQTRALARLREKRARIQRQLAGVPASNDARRKILLRRLRAVESDTNDWRQWSAA